MEERPSDVWSTEWATAAVYRYLNEKDSDLHDPLQQQPVQGQGFGGSTGISVSAGISGVEALGVGAGAGLGVGVHGRVGGGDNFDMSVSSAGRGWDVVAGLGGHRPGMGDAVDVQQHTQQQLQAQQLQKQQKQQQQLQWQQQCEALKQQQASDLQRQQHPVLAWQGSELQKSVGLAPQQHPEHARQVQDRQQNVEQARRLADHEMQEDSEQVKKQQQRERARLKRQIQKLRQQEARQGSAPEQPRTQQDSQEASCGQNAKPPTQGGIAPGQHTQQPPKGMATGQHTHQLQGLASTQSEKLLPGMAAGQHTQEIPQRLASVQSQGKLPGMAAGQHHTNTSGISQSSLYGIADRSFQGMPQQRAQQLTPDQLKMPQSMPHEQAPMFVQRHQHFQQHQQHASQHPGAEPGADHRSSPLTQESSSRAQIDYGYGQPGRSSGNNEAKEEMNKRRKTGQGEGASRSDISQYGSAGEMPMWTPGAGGHEQGGHSQHVMQVMLNSFTRTSS